jgi:hypothetical protein
MKRREMQGHERPVFVTRLDRRDVAHSRGLLGVVFEVGQGDGVQVATEAGVLSTDGDA